MKKLRRYMVIGIIFVLITGTLAHFVFRWSNNNKIVGLFTPINESIWEHMKLLFFPMLLYSIILMFKFRNKYPCIISALCFGIIAGTALIPIFYYTYTLVTSKDIFAIDIGIFIFSIAIAFWLSYKLTLSRRTEPYTTLLCTLVFILFICFMRFSYNPPNNILFEDPMVK